MRSATSLGIVTWLLSAGLAQGLQAAPAPGGCDPKERSGGDVCPDGPFVDAVTRYNPVPPGGIVHEKCSEPVGVPVVEYTIESDGRVRQVRFVRSSGCPEADAELQRCMLEWVFTPATCDSEPIRIERSFYVNWGYGPPPEDEDQYCQPFQEEENGHRGPKEGRR